MSFERHWMLFMLLVPLVWIIWNWRASARRRYLVVRALGFSAFALAASGPAFVLRESKTTVTVLADTSGSMSDQDLKHESDLIRGMENARGENTLRVVPFARSTRIAEQPQQIESRGLVHIPGAAERAADIERAIRHGIATISAGSVPRIVILSGGRENVGNVLRAAKEAKLVGVPIDTIPLAVLPHSRLFLEMAATPTRAFSSQPVWIDLVITVITSPRSIPAEIVSSSQDRRPNSSRIFLEEGVNHVRVTTRLAAVGEVELSVAVHAGDAGELRFSQPLRLRQPRALLVSADVPAVDPHLMNQLASAHFQVRRTASVPANLAPEQMVLLNDWTLQTIPLVRKTALEDFVKAGGVSAVIGGHNEDFTKGTREDTLDRTLPARFAPNELSSGSCFVLVLQRSASMQGKKMELARIAALDIVENLKRNDALGVLTFADRSEWTVPIHKPYNRDSTNDVIEAVGVGGGSRIAPALAEALRRILAVDATTKHIVLLTDGRAQDVDTLALARRAAGQHVTISTVGLGDRQNARYLTTLARRTGGQSYFINGPLELEATVVRDTMMYSDSTAIETGRRSGVLEGARIKDSASQFALPGQSWGQFVPKLRAEVLVGRRPTDPGLIRWQFGWGSAEIITAQPMRRSEGVIPSKRADEIWEELAGDLPEGTPRAEVTAEYDKEGDEFVIDYRFPRHTHVPAMDMKIFLFGPHGFGSPLLVEKISETLFRARVRCNNNSGLFRVFPLSESSALPKVQLYRHDPELDDRGPNVPLLKRVSEITGGRFNPEPRSIFDANGRTALSKLQLWSALVFIAIALLLVDWIYRRRRDVLHRSKRFSFDPLPRPVLDRLDRHP